MWVGLGMLCWLVGVGETKKQLCDLFRCFCCSGKTKKKSEKKNRVTPLVPKKATTRCFLKPFDEAAEERGGGREKRSAERATPKPNSCSCAHTRHTTHDDGRLFFRQQNYLDDTLSGKLHFSSKATIHYICNVVMGVPGFRNQWHFHFFRLAFVSASAAKPLLAI
jgi:hypothetical protein